MTNSDFFHIDKHETLCYNHVTIVPIHLSNQGHGWTWLDELTLGKRWCKPWTGHQFVTGLTETCSKFRKTKNLKWM